ncbi:O-antigen ligase family protein [Winogradskyella vidalii]|uniref:O-antigen ligase family protein n=1 Tax=Winogradskyella vidalii TaxID=2615024 RepID=UPI0015C919CF|nr:O-antigen ligase family protein [Winogradskyella vidalii]
MKLFNKIYHYLFYALVFTIPFEDDIRAVPNILIGVLFALLLFVEKKPIRKLLANKLYLIAIVFVLFIALSSLIIGTISEDMFVIKKLFILIAVLVLSLPLKKDFKLLLFFIASVTLGNLISVFNLVNFTLEAGSFEIASGQHINDLLIIERLYFGFINSISIAFSLKIWSKVSKKYKIIIALNMFLSVCLLFLVVSRMAIITVLLLIMIKIFYETNFKKSLITIVLILGTITAFFLFNDNLAKRFLYVDKKNDFFHKIREWEPRYVIWNCGLSHVGNSEHNLLVGDGFYETQGSLNDCYINAISKKNRVSYFLETRFNTHNQYLDLLLSKGIIGLVVFLLLIYGLMWYNKKEVNQLNILLVLVLFALVENLFHRQIGVYLFAIILTVLTLKSEDNLLDE